MVRAHPCPQSIYILRAHMKKDKKIKVPAVSSGVRLDVFLAEKLKITRSQAQKLIDGGLVSVNGKLPKKAGDRISAGTIITISEPKPKQPGVDSPVLKTSADFKILADTADYLIVDKPTGILTHSTEKNESDSLAEILLKKYPEIKKVGENPLRPGIVHRLDKEASGLLVVAKNGKMFDCLKEQFKNHTVDKEYLVLVHDMVEKDEGEINFPIVRSKSGDRMSALPATTYGQKQDEGRMALSQFTVEKRFVNFTLLRVKIRTGRMHQIRVHMLAYNHPVVGDPLYFQKKQKRTWDKKLGRLFLHCTKLVFKDLNGQSQSFESPLPEDLRNFLQTIK